VPAKPVWISRLPEIEAELESLPVTEIDRTTIERILGIKERRAQQLMAGLPGRTIGTSFVVDGNSLITRLRAIAGRGEYEAEAQRRNHLASRIEEWRRDWIEHPRVLVEAPTGVVSATLESLPGVRIEAGLITIRFVTAHEALEKLLALAMAIGNDFDAFETMAEPEAERGQ
jgi:hypothetical protein